VAGGAVCERDRKKRVAARLLGQRAAAYERAEESGGTFRGGDVGRKRERVRGVLLLRRAGLVRESWGS
jgi:hypothetical protein